MDISKNQKNSFMSPTVKKTLPIPVESSLTKQRNSSFVVHSQNKSKLQFLKQSFWPSCHRSSSPTANLNTDNIDSYTSPSNDYLSNLWNSLSPRNNADVLVNSKDKVCKSFTKDWIINNSGFTIKLQFVCAR